jgi:lipoate---protein ligase
VLGPSCRPIDDVDVAACAQNDVPVLRRASGGGTVLQGPGCLSYALVLPLTWDPRLANIRSTNQFILERMATALHRWEPATGFQGVSDLAIGGRKVSGNAQRRKRNALLFHGTILYAMESDLIARYLKHPARQPEYRNDRPHEAFLRTIDASPGDLKQVIAEVWNAHSPLALWPEARMVDSIRNIIERTNGDSITARSAENTISVAEEES